MLVVKELVVTCGTKHYFVTPLGTMLQHDVRDKVTFTLEGQHGEYDCFLLNLQNLSSTKFNLVFNHYGRFKTLQIICRSKKEKSYEDVDKPPKYAYVSIDQSLLTLLYRSTSLVVKEQCGHNLLLLSPPSLFKWFEDYLQQHYPDGQFAVEAHQFINRGARVNYNVYLDSIENIEPTHLATAIPAATEILIYLESDEQIGNILNIGSIKGDGKWELNFNRKKFDVSAKVINEMKVTSFNQAVQVKLRQIHMILQMHGKLEMSMGCFMVKRGYQNRQKLEIGFAVWSGVLMQITKTMGCYCAIFEAQPGLPLIDVAIRTTAVLRGTTVTATAMSIGNSSISVFFMPPISFQWLYNNCFTHFEQKFAALGLKLKSLGPTTRKHLVQLMIMEVNKPFRDTLFDLCCRLHTINWK